MNIETTLQGKPICALQSSKSPNLSSSFFVCFVYVVFVLSSVLFIYKNIFRANLLDIISSIHKTW